MCITMTDIYNSSPLEEDCEQCRDDVARGGRPWCQECSYGSGEYLDDEDHHLLGDKDRDSLDRPIPLWRLLDQFE